MGTTIDKNFKPLSREIRYLGKDFDGLKSNLIEFAKQYYPRTYKDFNDSSPGMMFIDMASYVGDVLSFYIDYQFKEGLINFAEERKNVINLVKFLGYTPKPSRPSITTLDLYQIIPSKRNEDGSFEPDTRYALIVKEGMEAMSSNRVSFITTETVDFSIKSNLYPRVDEVFSRNSSGEPEFYLIKKSVKAYSGKTINRDFNISSQTPNLRIELPEDNVLKILEIKDSDNNNWYQVDYLAQDLVSLPVENNRFNFELFSNYSSTVPNIIKFLRTNRRFIIEVDENNKTYIQFGPSTDSLEEEILVPNSELLGTGFSNISRYNLTLDPTVFVKSNSYGSSPFNTTLSVKYVIGGGLESNANVDDITTISKIQFEDAVEYLPSEESLLNTVKTSLRVTNPIPATGGAASESILEIKQNAMANFAAQDRMVTKDDYVSRVLSMPSEYGRVAKAYVSSESELTSFGVKPVPGLLDENNNIIIDSSYNGFRKVNIDGGNPFGINLYVLTYDDNKNLTPINEALVYNLKQYISKYRMISDRVNIIDGYIVNIGLDFTILTYSTYNKKEVLANCISAVKKFFDIELWQFCQPINIGQLELEIAKVEGVQSVSNLEFKNLVGGNYSNCEYDLIAATKHKIIYPPVDPAVFEIKYPDVDIRGKVL
jgi:hypothetical protein